MLQHYITLFIILLVTRSGICLGYLNCYGRYTIVQGDTCQSITDRFELEETIIWGVDCTKTLISGNSIEVCQEARLNCGSKYNITSLDTCATLTTQLSTSKADLKHLYGIDCNNITPTEICITHKHHYGHCITYHTVMKGETCSSIIQTNGLTSWELFYMNPTLICSQLKAHDTLCLDLLPGCSQYYTVKDGDSWDSITSQFSLSPSDFKLLNPRVKYSKKHPSETFKSFTKKEVCVAKSEPFTSDQLEWGELLLNKDLSRERGDIEDHNKKRSVLNLCNHKCSSKATRDSYTNATQGYLTQITFHIYSSSYPSVIQRNLDRQTINLAISNLHSTFSSAWFNFSVSAINWRSGFSSRQNIADDVLISSYSATTGFNVHVFTSLKNGAPGYSYPPGDSFHSRNIWLRKDMLDNPTFSHEMGYSLGLYRTHEADCGCGNTSSTGDQCEDTYQTPSSFPWSNSACQFDSKDCAKNSVPDIASANIMSYSLTGDWTCRKSFSPNQLARARCFAHEDPTLKSHFVLGTTCGHGTLMGPTGICQLPDFYYGSAGSPLPAHYAFDRIGTQCPGNQVITGLTFARANCNQYSNWTSGNPTTPLCPSVGTDSTEGLVMAARCLEVTTNVSGATWKSTGTGSPLSFHFFFTRVGGECAAGEVAIGVNFQRGGCGQNLQWTDNIVDTTTCSTPADNNEGLTLQLNCVAVVGATTSTWRVTGVGASITAHYYLDRIGAVCLPGEAVSGVTFVRGGCLRVAWWDEQVVDYNQCGSPSDVNEGLIMKVKCTALTGGVSYIEREPTTQFHSQVGKVGFRVPIGWVGFMVGLVGMVAVVVIWRKRFQEGASE